LMIKLLEAMLVRYFLRDCGISYLDFECRRQYCAPFAKQTLPCCTWFEILDFCLCKFLSF
jgi:hypothetical protein